MIEIIFASIFLLLGLSSLLGGFISFSEREKRAGLIFISLSVLLLILSILGFFTDMLPDLFMYIASVAVLFSAILLLLPIKGKQISWQTPNSCIDERITMFSRAEISGNKNKMAHFYDDYPELKPKDEKWKNNPGLGSEKSKYYKELAFTAADASFSVIEKNRQYREPKPSDNKIKIEAEEAKTFIEKWLKQLGAYDSGICTLEKYHIYSKRGRGAAYGKTIDIDHKYVISIIVPMDKKMIDSAPKAPTMMESACEYTKAGIIALQLSEFITSCGYSARAHIDGAYDLVLPLLAADSGLGTIGRMGLLIHPELGPACRIAAVSTDLPLKIHNKKKKDTSVIKFCKLCKKCANVCPSAAITKADPGLINGIKRWQIDQEACYTYWTKAGTDCARCMSVCPYSHENNILHRFIRFGIKNNFMFRRLAVNMDDIFYGKKPSSKKIPVFEQ